MYPASGGVSDVPVLGTFLLSPIKELDTGSLNNTLHASSPSLSRIITVNSGPDLTDAPKMVSTQMPVVSMTPTSAAISSPVTLPAADTTISIVSIDDQSIGGVPSRRRFEVSRKESLRKSTSIESGSTAKSSSMRSSKEAAEKKISDGNVDSKTETGEVYV